MAVTKKQMQDILDTMNQVSKNLDVVAKKMDATTTKAKTGFEKVSDSVEELTDDLSKYKKGLEESKKSAKWVDDLEKNLQTMNTDLQSNTAYWRNIQKEIEKARNKFDDFTKSSSELEQTSKIVGNMGSGLGDMKSLFGSLGKSPVEFIKNLENSSKKATELKQSAESVKGVSKALDLAGGAAKGLGVAMGGIAKVLSGPIGMIAFAVVQVAQLALKADSMIKQMNKDFNQLRGPELFTPDIKRQFEEFNNAIIDVAKNIQDGLQAEEVYNFMSAMNAAGQRISTLNQGLYNYRDAVHIAAKASKNFGMDMTTVGALMGKLITDYNMDLGKMDDAFAQVAFDAQKSGLSTDRFLTAVENASAGLSMYGVFIKGVSKTISDLTKTQLVGADAAASAAGDMTQVFKKNTMEANMSFVEIAKRGGADFSKAFQEEADKISEEMKDRAKDITKLESKYKIEPSPGLEDQIEKLKSQQEAANIHLQDINKSVHGSTMVQAQNLPYLSHKGPKLMMSLIKGVNGVNFSTINLGNSLAVASKGIEGLQQAGISGDDVRLLLEQGRQAANSLRSSLGIGTEGEKTSKSVVKWLKRIRKDDVNSINNEKAVAATLSTIHGDMTPDAIDSTAETLAKQMDIDKDSAKTLVKNMLANKEMSDGVKGIINGVAKGTIKTDDVGKLLEKQIMATDAGYKMVQAQGSDQDKSNTDVKDSYDETFKQIKDQTLSAEDMMNITKKGITYEAANLAYQNGISQGVTALNNTVGNIAGWVEDIFSATKDADKKREKRLADEAAARKKATEDAGKNLNDLGIDIKKSNEELVTKEAKSGGIAGILEDAFSSQMSGSIKETKKEKVYDPIAVAYSAKMLKEQQQAIVSGTAITQRSLADLGEKLDTTEKEAQKTGEGSITTGGLLAERLKEMSASQDAAGKQSYKQLQTISKSSLLSGGDPQIVEGFNSLMKKIEVGNAILDAESKKGTKADKKAMELAQDQIDEAADAAEKMVDPKKLKENIKMQKMELPKTAKAAQEQITKSDAIITNLKSTGAISSGMLDLMTLNMASDEKGQKALLGTLKDQYKGKDKIDVKDLQNTPMGKAQYQAAQLAGKVKKDEAGNETIDVSSLAKGGIATGPTLAQIGEKGPEAVVPLSKPNIPFFDMRGRAPGLPEAPAAGGGGPTGKSISITVNATEQNLAQRIANEVRAVLYKEQVPS